MSPLSRRKRWIVAAMVGIVLAVSLGVTADAGCECWTRSGNDGTLDESVVTRALFADPGVAVNAAGPFPFALTIRYNVESLPFFLSQSFATHDLTVTYIDNGPNAQVLLRLMEVPFATGVATEKTQLRFNSNSFPASSGVQTQTISLLPACTNPFGFDFDNNFYYVLARLTRSAQDGNPRLMGLKIHNASLNCG